MSTDTFFTTNCMLVKKEKIAESGEYNFGGERYKITNLSNSDYAFVKIGDFFKTSSGGTPLKSKTEYFENGKIPWLNSGEVSQGYIYTTINYITEKGLQNSSAKLFPVNTVLVAMYGATAGKVGLLKIESTTNQAICGILPRKECLPEYLFYILKAKEDYLLSLGIGGAQPNISQTVIKDLQIPLPPLSVQQEIVEELDSYQKIIDGARQVVENWKPRIKIDPGWPMVELGEVCEINPKKSEIKDFEGKTEVSFVPMADLNENEMAFVPKQIKTINEVYSGYTYFREDDVLLAKVTPCFENGKAGIAKNLKNGIGFGSSDYYVIRPNNKILSTWIYLNIVSNPFREKGKLNMTGTGGLQRVPPDYIKTHLIPLPDINVQKTIIESILNEQNLITSNKHLSKIFEKKIKDRIAEVWGE